MGGSAGTPAALRSQSGKILRARKAQDSGTLDKLATPKINQDRQGKLGKPMRETDEDSPCVTGRKTKEKSSYGT